MIPMKTFLIIILLMLLMAGCATTNEVLYTPSTISRTYNADDRLYDSKEHYIGKIKHGKTYSRIYDKKGHFIGKIKYGKTQIRIYDNKGHLIFKIIN